MWKNNIKIAWRSILGQRGNSLINIAGLSIALAATLLILLWVQDEWEMNKFHSEIDRLHLVRRTIPLEGELLDVYLGVPYPMLQAAQDEIPEVERFVPIGYSSEETVLLDEIEVRAKGTYANTAYFEAFSFPIIMGDIGQLDDKTDAVVISQSLAKRLFGNTWETTALNKSIRLHDIGDFTIEAIFEDFPSNSSLQNEFLYSFQYQLKDNEWLMEWTNSGMSGLLMLQPGSDPIAVGESLQTIFRSHLEGERKEGCFLQPLADSYLYGRFDDQAQVSGGRIDNVRLFTVAAFLLLIISCINFMNLATARASVRAKEVGVRKVVGAGKSTLVRQFMTEATLMTALAVLLALVLSNALLPYVRTLTGKELTFDYGQPIFWIGIGLVTLLTILLSGAYPAFILSSFSPKFVLKGRLSLPAGNTSLRKGLVVTQFALALFLIVGALVVQQQVDYVLNKNLGLSKDNMLVLNKEDAMGEKFDLLRNELKGKPGIDKITTAGPTPIDLQASTSGVQWPGKQADQDHIEFQILWTESNFLEVFEVEMAAGEFYRKGLRSDTMGIVFNERAIEVMALEEPIGSTIEWWGRPRQIIGVVKDFHNRSLHDKIEPTGILLEEDNTWSIFVKHQPGEASAAIASLKEVYSDVLPGFPFHYEFVDEQYAMHYEREMLTSALARYFAMISIVISCLGLLGLITFAAIQKKKEIGIRKVLGANVAGLVGLLSKDFLMLVLLALLIATPLTWYLMQQWLQNFSYHIDLHWTVFLIAGLASVLITLLTVSFQSVKAALANPVDSLRNE